MKVLALLSLNLAVTLGVPLPGDLLPAQGHVVVDDPVPQLRLFSEEQQEKKAPVPVDMEQSQSVAELEVKVKPVKQEGEGKTEVKVEQELKAEPEVKVAPEVKAEPDVKAEPEVKEEPEVEPELEVKAESEVKEEPEVEPELEVKAESEVKEEPEVEPELEVKEEPEVEAEPEVKEEPEVEPELEVKAESEVKEEPEVEPELEVKEEPEVEAEPEVKEEPEVEAEPEVKEEPETEAEPEVKEEPEIEPELEVKEEPEVEMEAELKDDPDLKVESEVKVEPDVQEETELEVQPMINEEQEVQEKFQVQMTLEEEPEMQRHIDEEGKYEMVSEPIMELEPLDDDNMFEDEPSNTELSEMEKSLRAAFQNQGPDIQPLTVEEEEEEEELMTEKDYVLDKEPIMELEPLDDDNMSEDEPSDTELSEMEKSLTAAFQNQGPDIQPLTVEEEEEEEEELMTEKDHVLDKEPIMELEPLDDDNMSEDEPSDTELSEMEKSLTAAFKNQGPDIQPLTVEEEEEELMTEKDHVSDEEPNTELDPEMSQEELVPDAASMEEGPALDIMGKPISASEEYFPNEEARMGMEPGNLTEEPSEYMMMEEPGTEFVREEELPPRVGTSLSEEPAKEDKAERDGGVQTLKRRRVPRSISRPEQDNKATRQSCWTGVILEGKCYQFFKEPKRAWHAEFFCQEHFPGGHLASITSQHIHRELMNMILQQNGAYTRTWIGGLRYLETGRFIWLDGSQWSYADWLSGEPNNTADVEDCVEVLSFGNGKFNDFTCWEPQAFICSFPYQ